MGFNGYPSSASDEAPCMANAFVDRMQGVTDEEIATRPRRFVFIHKNQKTVPEHVKKFVGGGYTNDNSNFVHKRKRKQRDGYADQGEETDSSAGPSTDTD